MKIALFKLDEKNHSEDKLSCIICIKWGDKLTCGKILEKDFCKNYLSTCVTLRGLRDNDRRASDV